MTLPTKALKPVKAWALVDSLGHLRGSSAPLMYSTKDRAQRFAPTDEDSPIYVARQVLITILPTKRRKK